MIQDGQKGQAGSTNHSSWLVSMTSSGCSLSPFLTVNSTQEKDMKIVLALFCANVYKTIEYEASGPWQSAEFE